MSFPLSTSVFKTRFPHFADVDDTLVQAKLDEAEQEIDETVWDTKAETGHGYLTAHKLSLEPSGRDARLKKDEARSTYSVEFDRLARMVGGSYRVVLD